MVEANHFATPIANLLATEPVFRQWVVAQTKFRELSKPAMLLSEELMARRHAGNETWWRNHFRMDCGCRGCAGGRPTYLLAVFSAGAERFALHCAVQCPDAAFGDFRDRADRYARRAECWLKNPPQTVLSHYDAAAVLFCSEKLRKKVSARLPIFDSVIPFEKMTSSFSKLSLPG